VLRTKTPPSSFNYSYYTSPSFIVACCRTVVQDSPTTTGHQIAGVLGKTAFHRIRNDPVLVEEEKELFIFLF
jgi:hypothetical protein